MLVWWVIFEYQHKLLTFYLEYIMDNLGMSQCFKLWLFYKSVHKLKKMI